MILFGSAQQLHQDNTNAVFGSAAVPDSPDHSLNHDSPSDSNNEPPSPAPSVVGDILTINGQVRSQTMPTQNLEIHMFNAQPNISQVRLIQPQNPPLPPPSPDLIWNLAPSDPDPSIDGKIVSPQSPHQLPVEDNTSVQERCQPLSPSSPPARLILCAACVPKRPLLPVGASRFARCASRSVSLIPCAPQPAHAQIPFSTSARSTAPWFRSTNAL
jgi:hypothetical protein